MDPPRAAGCSPRPPPAGGRDDPHGRPIPERGARGHRSAAGGLQRPAVGRTSDRCLDMRITSVEAIPYALSFKEPYVTARGRLERREMVLVRARTDEGAEGLGDAVPLSLRGGSDVGS